MEKVLEPMVDKSETSTCVSETDPNVNVYISIDSVSVEDEMSGEGIKEEVCEKRDWFIL